MLNTDTETLRSFVITERLFEPSFVRGNAYSDMYLGGTSGTPPPGGSEPGTEGIQEPNPAFEPEPEPLPDLPPDQPLPPTTVTP